MRLGHFIHRLKAVHANCTGVVRNLGIFGIRTATLNVSQPAIVQDLVDGKAFGWVWVKHPQEKTSKCRPGNDVEYFTTRRVIDTVNRPIGVFLQKLIPAHKEVGVVGIISRCNLPGRTAEEHSQTDDGTRPDIKRAWIIGSWEKMSITHNFMQTKA